MKWDVFVSHASEDKEFARRLVNALEDWGLRVWFDERILNIGDSLRRSIDQGLADSEYGVVILSNNFFAKEWTKKELDGLVAREDGKEKVILPIWHDIGVDEVRKFSPMLADKVSVYSSGPVSGVAEKILRAIYQSRVDSKSWSPITHVLSNGIELVLLPIRPRFNRAVGIAKHPTTNAQYMQFMKGTGRASPIGEVFYDNDWHGPFLPLDDPRFNHPNQPVVCVDYKDASAYCQWIENILNRDEDDNWKWQAQVFLPLAELWDFAAYGNENATENIRHLIFSEQQEVHHISDKPAVIDESGVRTNKRGISDMFGNVWEWCSGDFTDGYQINLILPERRISIELRGGSFLDNLKKMRKKPALPANILEDGIRTRHTDLGFRIAAMVDVNQLSQEERMKLTLQRHLSAEFWKACELAANDSEDYDAYQGWNE